MGASARPAAGGPPAFRAAHARGSDWFQALRACLVQLEPVPAGANVGFIYLGEPMVPFADMILHELQRSIPIEVWVGAGGRRALGTLPDLEVEGGMAILLAALPAGSFQPLHDHGPRRPGAAAILHTNRSRGEGTRLLDSLNGEPGTYVIGLLDRDGLADMQIAGGVTGGVSSGLLLSADVPLLPLAARNCIQLGPPCSITSRVGSTIRSLDQRPALQVVLERAGDLARARPERVLDDLVLGEIGQLVTRPPRTACRLSGVDRSEGHLHIDPADLSGRQVALLLRDLATAEREMREALDRLREQLEGRRPGAVIYFTSTHRARRLTAAGLDEVALLRSYLGDVPVVGLVTDSVIIEDRVEISAAVAAVFA